MRIPKGVGKAMSGPQSTRDLEVKKKIKEKKKETDGWKAGKDWRMKRRNTSGTRITIKLPVGYKDGSKIKLDVTKDTKIGDIKKSLKDKSGFFPAQYRLKCGEVFLAEDHMTLDQYNIADGAKFIMVLHEGMSGYQYKEGETFAPQETKSWEEKVKGKKK